MMRPLIIKTGEAKGAGVDEIVVPDTLQVTVV